MKTVLVVEDDKLLGKTVCGYLEKAGYGVFWAQSAKQAYEAMESQEINLILLDIMMPEIDGFEALKQIRASEKLRDIPVVILSNLSDTKDMDRAMSLGATDYIVKSNIELSDLVEKIKTEYLV